MSATKEKKPYEIAVEEFERADAAYKALEETFLAGDFLPDLVRSTGGDEEKLKDEYRGFVDELKEKLEERNAKLKTAQDLMRAQVIIPVSEWRGIDGTPKAFSCGSLTATSVTSRWLNPKALMEALQKKGLLERYMSLTGRDKDGAERKLIEQSWDILYEDTVRWLRSNQLEDVVEAAYDEKDKTPQCSGAKPLTFLGDKKG